MGHLSIDEAILVVSSSYSNETFFLPALRAIFSAGFLHASLGKNSDLIGAGIDAISTPGSTILISLFFGVTAKALAIVYLSQAVSKAACREAGFDNITHSFISGLSALVKPEIRLSLVRSTSWAFVSNLLMKLSTDSLSF